MFLTKLLFICLIQIKSQTISNVEYSIYLEINDHFPSNLSNLLNKKGFILLNQEGTEKETSFEYTLKKYDKYYYHVILSKIGGMQQVVLTFNDNSKAAEFDPFVANIREFMTLQPKVNSSLNKATIYKDNSGFYYAYEAHPEDHYYLISILNYNAFYELHLKKEK